MTQTFAQGGNIYRCYKPSMIVNIKTLSMKSTKVQTLGTVVVHATTACTNDTTIVAIQLGYSLVSFLVLHVVGSVHVHMY